VPSLRYTPFRRENFQLENATPMKKRHNYFRAWGTPADYYYADGKVYREESSVGNENHYHYVEEEDCFVGEEEWLQRCEEYEEEDDFLGDSSFSTDDVTAEIEKDNKRYERYKKWRGRGQLKQNLYNRLYKVLRGKERPRTVMEVVGCDLDELRDHLESQFTDGMTWNNYGGWEIDHIIPLVAFDLTDELQLRAATHYTNLQPLWKNDNIRKSGKYKHEDLAAYLESWSEEQ